MRAQGIAAFVAALPLLAMLALLEPVVAEGSTTRYGAFLAFSREVDGVLVQGNNVTVRYEIRNVGTEAATDVALKDLSFPLSRFTLHEGTFRATFARLEAGSGTVATAVITPKKAGELLVSPATLTYSDGDVRRVSRLASDESIVVEDLLAYKRRTDKHRTEWGLYALASVLLVGGPLFWSTRVLAGVSTGAVGKKRN